LLAAWKNQCGIIRQNNVCYISNAKIHTAKASGYLQQLCKHFSHKIDVEFTPEAGIITFDFGKADLIARPDMLQMTATAESAADLSRLEQVLGSHLERFAFREELKIKWDN